MGCKEAMSIVDKQRDKFAVNIGLPTGIHVEAILDIWRGRVTGLTSLQ